MANTKLYVCKILLHKWIYRQVLLTNLLSLPICE